MAILLMAGHMGKKHGRVAGEIWIWTLFPPVEEPQTLRMAFRTTGGLQSCSIEGCPGRAATRTAMQVNFMHRNVRDTVVILEEVPPPPQPR